MKYVVHDPADYADIGVNEAAPEPEKWTLAHRVKTLEAEILRLRAENEKLRAEIVEALTAWRVDREENEKLREALKPFAECNPIERNDEWFAHEVKIEDFRAASAVYKETKNGR